MKWNQYSSDALNPIGKKTTFSLMTKLPYFVSGDISVGYSAGVNSEM